MNKNTQVKVDKILIYIKFKFNIYWILSRRQDSTCNLMVPNHALHQLSYPRINDTMGVEPIVDRLKAVALTIMLRVLKWGV